MKLRFGILVSLMLLAGCGLPPALVVASYAADGISYLASGKSLTDHAMSVLVQRDCALHRVVTEADLCRDNAVDSSDTVAVAAVLPPDDEGVNDRLDIAPMRIGPRWGPITASLPPTDIGQPSPGVVINDGPYLVLASFVYWVNADRLVAQYPTLALEVVPAQVDGETLYRVVTAAGPAVVGTAGFAQAWPLRPCRDMEDGLAACAGDGAGAINVAALTR